MVNNWVLDITLICYVSNNVQLRRYAGMISSIGMSRSPGLRGGAFSSTNALTLSLSVALSHVPQ